MSLLRDITTNHETGHYVGKDVFKAGAFAAGLGIVLFAAYADHHAGRPVGIEGAVLLLTYAFGVGAAKAVEGYYNRKTADDNSNPLQQKGTEEAPAGPVIPVPNPPAGQE